MKEYIERAAIIPALEDYYEPINPDFPMTLGLGQISEVLQNIPAADVAEVVRCQDCKYRIYKDMGDDIGMIGGCQAWGVALPGDFYCAHGARMDKEDEHEAG